MAEDYNSIGFKNADIDKLKSIMSNFDKSGNKTESGGDPKLIDTKVVTRDSINNGKVVGKITETQRTYKDDSDTSKKTPVVPVKTKPVAVVNTNKKTPVVTTKKPSGNTTPNKSKTPSEETKIVKTKTFTPVVENTKVKTDSIKQKSYSEQRDEIKQKGREWMYLKWHEPNQTREQFQKKSDSIAKVNASKNRDKSVDLSGGSGKGPSGVCHNCR